MKILCDTCSKKDVCKYRKSYLMVVQRIDGAMPVDESKGVFSADLNCKYFRPESSGAFSGANFGMSTATIRGEEV